MTSAPRIFATLSVLLALLLGGCASQPERKDRREATPQVPPLSTPGTVTKQGRKATPAPPGPATDAPGSPAAATQPASLWTRLRSGFRLNESANPQISREIAWLRRHPEHVEEIARRARPFLWFIVEDAEARRLPLELALLPAVESGFRPWVRSRSGAAGLWQIMPRTARALGLKSTPWYDGCLDPLASTKAAFAYLERMQRRFAGDWLLALAAYNAGPGVVAGALERNRKDHRPADYWHLLLPPQTRTYVPRLLALTTVIAHPDAYGVHLGSLPNRPLLTRIEIPAALDLQVAARLADKDPPLLQSLNPAYIAGYIPPGGTHALLLPIEAQSDFETQLAGLDPAAWRPIQRRHRVIPGESLWRIARRYGTTVVALRRTNGLPNDRLRAGQELRLPDTDTPPPRRTHYVVRPGDNLWTIARRFGLDHRRIAAWNGLSPSRPLRPGQRLLLTPWKL